MSQAKKGQVLAIIPARSGSKGLPRKNIRLAAGRPLIAWTIAAAQAATVVNRVIVSTEDDEIRSLAAEYGCDAPFQRPAALATDTATSIDVVMHAIDMMPGFEFVILLQPTSPLRMAGDIDSAFNLMFERGAQSCVSVSTSRQSPYWMYTLESGDRIKSVLPIPPEGKRRQDLPHTYVLNGAIYIAHSDWLRHHRAFIDADTVAYRMPRERSVDIDDEDDFETFRKIVESSEGWRPKHE